MYEEHPIFEQPKDDQIKVWRYIDFTKFVSLLDSQDLFFTRVDKCEDPFEGSWPQINYNARMQFPKEIPVEGRKNFLLAMSSIGDISKLLTKHNAINCWHMNEHESAAMWKLYLRNNDGIAIQSRYCKLRSAFIDEVKVYVGIVKYIDYNTEWIEVTNLLSPFIHKRKSFEHEREIRAVVTRWPKDLSVDEDTIEEGINVKVDLNLLVEKVYVSPNSDKWFADLVRSTVRRFGRSFEVVHSELNRQPVF